MRHTLISKVEARSAKAAPPPHPPRPVVPDRSVRVNGVAVSAADIATEAQNHAGHGALSAFEAAARALVVRELLRQEAARRGIAPAPRDLGGGRSETDEEAAIRVLLEGETASAAPTEDALRAAYERHPERYRSPALYEASHILFAAAEGDEDARAEARRRAVVALASLAAEPAAFERLAAELSECPSRGAGGRLGQVGQGDTVPEFQAALSALEPGAIAPGPVETRYGLHVVRLDARAPEAVLPFEAVRARIAEGLERTAWAMAAKAFVGRLVAAASIEGIGFGSA